MAVIIVVVVILALIIIIFSFRGHSLGTSYKNYLLVTQMNLILGKFPKLSQQDVIEFMATHTCNQIRWILQQQYYNFFLSKQYDVLVKLMDEAMIKGGVYAVIEKWVKGLTTKDMATEHLNNN